MAGFWRIVLRAWILTITQRDAAMLFVFDVDWTLLDTIGDIGRACNIVLQKYGHGSFPLGRYADAARHSFRNIIGSLLPELSAEQNELLAEEAWLEYQANMMDRTAPYAGVEEMLHALAKRGDHLAVLSDKPDGMVKALTAHYFRAFCV